MQPLTGSRGIEYHRAENLAQVCWAVPSAGGSHREFTLVTSPAEASWNVAQVLLVLADKRGTGAGQCSAGEPVEDFSGGAFHPRLRFETVGRC